MHDSKFYSVLSSKCRGRKDVTFKKSPGKEISQEAATPVEEALLKASFKCLVDEICQEANKLGDEVRVILSPSAK